MTFLWRFSRFFIVALLMLHCNTPSETTPAQKEDGVITVQLSPSDLLRNKNITMTLFAPDVNIDDPAVFPLETHRFQLGSDGSGSFTFDSLATGGERYQVTGLIDYYNLNSNRPQNGDYFFRVTTDEIDGDTQISISEEDLTKYVTIAGSGSFVQQVIGEYHVRIWLADYWNGWTTLGWMGDVDNITFRYNGSGGAIGRVGRLYSQSAGGPIRVDEIDESPVNVNAMITDSAGGTRFFCIYGWVMNGLNWDSSTIRHEFYVIENNNWQESDPLIGTMTVDGIEYNMHKYDFGEGSYRFKAIRASDMRLSGPINMKPFFEYWRTNGMQNYYLDEMTWAIELLGGNHDGYFYCWNIEIPSYQ